MKTIDKETILTDYFSPSAYLRSWGRVEAALAEVQAELGMIPKEAAEVISKTAHRCEYDPETVLSEKERIGHPFIPFLRLLEKDCGEYGTWVHYGATTDNITYTGLALCIRNALGDVTINQTGLLKSLCSLASEHAETVMAGRTHSQQALPFTFGCKVAGWLDEFTRHLQRQSEAGKRCLTAMIGGAVGSGASFRGKAQDIQKSVADKLGLQAMSLPLRCLTDRWAELAQVYTLSASTLARMAADLKILCRTEVGEVFQDDGSVGSSTMPQKRNPVLYHYVLQAYNEIESILSRMQTIRAVADDGDSLTNNVLKEGIADIIKLYYAMVEKSRKIIDTLVVNTDRMKQNLQLDGGWIMAEALMFALSDKLGKTEAHDLLHDLAMESRKTGKNLKETALDHPEISRLGRDRIKQILDPTAYLGDCGKMTRETVEKIRKLL